MCQCRGQHVLHPMIPLGPLERGELWAEVHINCVTATMPCGCGMLWWSLTAASFPSGSVEQNFPAVSQSFHFPVLVSPVYLGIQAIHYLYITFLVVISIVSACDVHAVRIRTPKMNRCTKPRFRQIFDSFCSFSSQAFDETVQWYCRGLASGWLWAVVIGENVKLEGPLNTLDSES